MTLYAQTNVQLYEQLVEAGYSVSDLKLVRDGYQLLSQLLSAKFRANGKPQIAHFVGTASILAAHGAGRSVVLAGLLHAIYALGDFGSFWPRMTRHKRQVVRRVIGHEAECLVARYSLSQWDAQMTASLAKALPKMSEEERGVLLLRLANELEEAADLSCEHEVRRQQKMAQLVDYIEIARHMDMPRFAKELQEAYELARSQQIPVELKSSHIEVYDSPPLSYRRRLKPALSLALRNVWRRMPETVRSRFRRWSRNRAFGMN